MLAQRRGEIGISFVKAVEERELEEEECDCAGEDAGDTVPLQESAISRQHRYPSSSDNSDTGHVGRVSPLVLQTERGGGRGGEGGSVRVVIRGVHIRQSDSQSKQR
jgi:hypothetical protein